MVVVRIRYPRFMLERAKALAGLFEAPGVRVKLVEDTVDEIVIEGPTFATSDPTLATALLARHLLASRG